MKTAATDVEQRASRKRLDKVRAHILTPSELSQYWPAIRESISIAQNLEPEDRWITTTYKQILSGHADCWGIFADAGGDHDLFAGTMVTDTRYDVYNNTKTMAIISFQSFEVVSTDAWLEAFRILERYAAQNNFRTIAATTKNPRVVELMRLLGFDLETVGFKEVTP